MSTIVKATTNDWRAMAKAMANGDDFATSGALRGEQITGALTNWDMGRLPAEFYSRAMFAEYVVWSYSTPIACRQDGEWIVPEVKYSPTTTRHQSRIRAAIASL
jgi:hypothetical protein